MSSPRARVWPVGPLGGGGGPRPRRGAPRPAGSHATGRLPREAAPRQGRVDGQGALRPARPAYPSPGVGAPRARPPKMEVPWAHGRPPPGRPALQAGQGRRRNRLTGVRSTEDQRRHRAGPGRLRRAPRRPGTGWTAVRAAENAAGTRRPGGLLLGTSPVHPVRQDAPGLRPQSSSQPTRVAVNAALAGRILRAPALPRGVRVGLTLLDLQPQLRRELSASMGPLQHADVLMSLTSAPRRPRALPAADRSGRRRASCTHTQLLAEVAGPAGSGGASASRSSAPGHRRYTRRRRRSGGPARTRCPRSSRDLGGPLGPGSFAGALGVLFLTRGPRRAADAILAAAPRAARLGRESFAATSARRLARRRHRSPGRVGLPAPRPGVGLGPGLRDAVQRPAADPEGRGRRERRPACRVARPPPAC